MCKIRLWTPQDRAFVCAVKDALLTPHLGPAAIPRKAVASSIGRSEGWYSRVLNQEEYDWIPDLVDLRRITHATGNREPLRVLAQWMGEDLVERDETNPFTLLADTVGADDAFTTQLSQDLADGKLDREEALRLLEPASARLAQAQKTIDALRRVARRK
jgi:hypothetical protein